MMSRTKIFVALTALAALSALITLIVISPVADRAGFQAATSLIALGVLAQLLSHKVREGTRGSIASIPFLAAAVVVPSWITPGVVLAGAVISGIARRQPAIKMAFNSTQLSLSTSLAILAYLVLGGSSLLHRHDISWSAYAALVLVFFVANTVSVSSAIALSEHRRVLRVWRDVTRSSLIYDLMASPLAFAFGWVYAHYGATGAAGLALPLLAVRQVFKTNWQLEQATQELLELMVKAIEARDPYTSGHSQRVAHYSRVIGRAIGLHSRKIERIGIAALLHDVGKIHEIYAPLLRKTEKLTPEEWVVMKTHPIKSAELVQTVSQLRDVVDPVRHHHEAWDGTGYPDGLAGEEIPLAARVIAIADTIDAMATDRPYRPALEPEVVKEEIRRMRGRQFDPQICDQLLASPLFASLFGQRGQDRSAVERGRKRSPASASRAIEVA